MKTYKNSYFRLRLDFPDTWTLASWSHTKIARSWQALYQATDDELPSESAPASKFLFTAALHRPEGQAHVDADIELSVFRLSPREDMGTSIMENLERTRAYNESNGIVKSITHAGRWTIGGIDFGYVDEQSTYRRGKSRYRFIFRRVEDTLWLYGKIAGHKEQAFEEALKIVEGMKPTDDESISEMLQ